jgi:hypothetical protein
MTFMAIGEMPRVVEGPAPGEVRRALTQEAALVVMGVEQRQLLMAVHDIRECRRQVGGRSWRRATITRIGRAASRKPGAFSHRETVA